MQQEPTRLRAARVAAGWSQSRLIAAMRAAAPHFGLSLPGDDSLKTSIKRWESGRITPGVEYRRLLQYIYAMTGDQLGFPPSYEPTAQPPNARTSQLSGEALDYHGFLLEEHLRADNLLGPRHSLEIVREQVSTLSSAAREARGQHRRPVLQMACRYYEFYGWLLQDLGRCEDATISTDRARDLAVEIGDTSLIAYLMMRRSNIATDDGDPALAAGLVNAALTTHGSHLTSKIRAVLTRQQANAYAGLGQTTACASALSEAFDLAGPGTVDGPNLADYCTPGYVSMEAGTCWLNLGHPDRAVAAFARAPTEWDPALRRDQGLFLARKAAAQAGAGDIATACDTAHEAIGIVTVTRSARTLRELQRLRGQLIPLSPTPQVIDVRQAIATLTAVA